MRGADILVELLKIHGVKYIFGVPGDTSMAFYDALLLHSEDIEHILFRDERHAVYAADAYARLTRKPGVVEVPSGGGALYAVPGLSEANMSNIPVICIASDISMISEETYALTDCNQEELFSAVTKWNTKLHLTEKIPQMLRKAFRMSVAGIPGAVALSFPEDILRGEYNGSSKDCYPFVLSSELDNFRVEVMSKTIDTVVHILRDSKCPVILAGGGVHMSDAYQELERFASTNCIPVVTSIDGKGSVSEYASYALGTIGANGGSREANEVVRESDLIVVLGCKLDNVTTMGGKIIGLKTKIIQVDLDEAILGNTVRTGYPIISDINMILKKLNNFDFSDKFSEWKKWVLFCKDKKIIKYKRLEKEYLRESNYVVVARIFYALEKFTSDNTVFLGDAGTPTPYICEYLRQKKAGKCCIIPRAHGALGFALGAAIGAQIARLDSKVICMFGDASFGMSMGELETIKRLNLPIILINFQNDCYGWIKTIQRLYYKEQYFGVDFSTIDSVKIAEGFGIKGRNICKNEEIEETIIWALEQNEPIFLNVKVEPPSRYIPPVQQWEDDAALDPTYRKKIVY